MEIRLAQERDLDRLAEVFAESFTKADPGKPWSNERARDLISHFYRHQPDLFFVAAVGGAIVGGMAVLIKPWRDGNRCTEGILFVDSAQQKSGVGTQLFARGLEEAQARYDARIFEAITFAEKRFPLTWYERIGFREDADAVFIRGSVSEMLKNLRG